MIPEIEQLIESLSRLSKQIDARINEYQAKVQRLERDLEEMKQRYLNGGRE